MELPGRLVLLGHPVAHSRSPALHNAALRSAGIGLEYVAVDVPPADLDAAVHQLVAERAAGNVTTPHKRRMLELCGELTPLARRTGAVNSFRVRNGVLQGENTDIHGFQALAEQVLGGAPRDRSVAVLGTGGAASAVLAAVEGWPDSRAVVLSRSVDRARRLAAHFPGVASAGTDLETAIAEADIVVNATPLGLGDHDPFPADLDLLSPGTAVLDLTYAAGRTRWVREAAARGYPAADGASMLLEQGVAAFVHWLGVEPDREAMRAALAASLGGEEAR